MPFEPFRVWAGDGVRIGGWYIPAPQTPRGLVIVCHGYYGNRATMLPYLSFLHRAGFATIVFDFRGHGWSGGAMTTFGIAETLDLAAVLDWTETHSDLAHLPVGVLGESMGGAVALLVGAGDVRVHAIVTDSTFARFDYAVEGRLKLAFGPRLSRHITPSTQRAGERLLGRPSHHISPADAARKFAPRPLLAIHGANDRLIAPINARRLADAAGPTATVWEVPRSPHVSSILVEKTEYARRVTDFFARAFATPAPVRGA